MPSSKDNSDCNCGKMENIDCSKGVDDAFPRGAHSLSQKNGAGLNSASNHHGDELRYLDMEQGQTVWLLVCNASGMKRPSKSICNLPLDSGIQMGLVFSLTKTLLRTSIR